MAAGNGLSRGPMNLLPPIYLYRRLLRAHRKHLPSEMRLLGDEYIKSEFRAHRDVENPVHLVSFYVEAEEGCLLLTKRYTLQIGFLTEWQLYAQKIEGDAWLGEKLDQGKISKMSGTVIFSFMDGERGCADLMGTDEQLGQLYELMRAIQKRGTEGDGSEESS
jgi:hypothetical protein